MSVWIGFSFSQNEFTEYVETCGSMTAVDLVTCVASKISTQALQDADALYWSKLAVELE